MLEIKKLNVEINGKQILNDLDLNVESGQVHVLMGQNGSGKSTLAQSLMGHPSYNVMSGEALLDGENILELEPFERCAKGMFLSFQYPNEVTGVIISSYLRMIYNKRHNTNLSPIKFRKLLDEQLKLLGMSEDFMTRYLNEGFSGGEKKRMEMLQMLLLEPRIAILDETDSGLDVDALRVISEAVNTLKAKTNMSVLLITHYSRILKHIEPDVVHIMKEGKIIMTGGKELAHDIEENGYDKYINS